VEEATTKIAALWRSIGFEHFNDGVYLRDTACDYTAVHAARRKELAVLGEEYRASRPR
jgi:hypothetical protein